MARGVVSLKHKPPQVTIAAAAWPNGKATGDNLLQSVGNAANMLGQHLVRSCQSEGSVMDQRGGTSAPCRWKGNPGDWKGDFGVLSFTFPKQIPSFSNYMLYKVRRLHEYNLERTLCR